MKKNRIVCWILLISSLLAAFSPLAGATEVEQGVLTDGFYSFDASNAYLGSGQIVENVGAAILYEVGTDSLMYAWNPDEQMYPSSLVKILTALIAVEKGTPDTVVTVEDSVLQTVPGDAVMVDLLPGEQMTLSDLLYCMMVGSANDAAAVIAHHISGSQEAFVDEMNAYARELGCTATNFTNVHGLHDQAQYTTARDMGRILARAVKNEAFMTYFSAQRHTVPATNLSESRGLASSNFLFESNSDGMTIYHDPRVVGGRTGTTNDGNRCLATSAKQNNMHLVCVVLGCQSTFAEDGRTMTYGSFKETSALYDAGFEGYKVARVLYEGQIFRQLPVVGGASEVVLGSHSSVQTILPKDATSDNLSYQYKFYQQELTAPISAGDKLCQLQIWNGSICVAQTDLYAMHDVHAVAQSMDVNADEPAADSWKQALMWIGIGAWMLVLIVLVVRYGRKIRSAFRRRRTKGNHPRRRSR